MDISGIVDRAVLWRSAVVLWRHTSDYKFQHADFVSCCITTI